MADGNFVDSRGERPDIERDRAARGALTQIFAESDIVSLAWSATLPNRLRYETRAELDGAIAAAVVDLLPNDGAIVTIGSRSQTFFVCGCGVLLWSTLVESSDSRPDNADEIALLATDPGGPAVACSECAGTRDTISCAPPAEHATV